MLHQPTIEKLLAMRLEPMVQTWRSFSRMTTPPLFPLRRNWP